MAEPYRTYQPGDEVFIRARVVEPCSSARSNSIATLRIEDFPSITITTFAPVSEIARADDIARLLARSVRPA